MSEEKHVQASNIAFEQQRDIGKAFREIADVRGEIKTVQGDLQQLRTAIIGIDGNNGLRGELREFMERLDEKQNEQDTRLLTIMESQLGQSHWKNQVETRLDNYLKFERAATCHGKSALDKYLEQLETDNVELKKQRIAGIIAIVTTLLGIGGGIITTLIVKLGG
jgi:hypothetical protein